MGTDFVLRAAPEEIARHRAAGLWRETTVLDDVRRWAAEAPDSPALLADTGGAEPRVLTYRELVEKVDRYAAALAELGVQPGHVVSAQLPNWWQAVALALATWQRGAVWASIMPTIAGRERDRMLARLHPQVFVSRDRSAPHVAHHVVLDGDRAPEDIDFSGYFDETGPVPADDRPADPDTVALVLFTSGTTGEPKAVLQTLDILNAGALTFLDEPGGDQKLRMYTPQSLMHIAATSVLVMTLIRGGSMLLSDRWEPARAAHQIEEFGVDQLLIVPSYLRQLVDAVPPRRAPGALRDVYVVGSETSAALMSAAADALGARVRSAWAMTEGGRIVVPPDASAHAAEHWLGLPGRGTEIALRPTGPDGAVTGRSPGELWMRGAAVCLATVGRDSGDVRLVAEHDQGWYDTGDLAVPDETGGYFLAGRKADRIGGAFMIPVADVENALLEHPAVEDVAIVGHRGGTEGCAVVVTTRPVELADLHAFLRGIDMTEWYWPTGVERVDALPRNGMGKVDKAALRRRLGARS